MGRHTEIQWCDSTVNPTTGCDGCELKIPGREGTCYATLIHESRLAHSLPQLYAADFHTVRLAPGRMAKAVAWPDLTGTARPDKPWLDGLPRIIFVGDLGDIMSRDVPYEYIVTEIFSAIASPKGRRHIWMLLTKKPKRLAVAARSWLHMGRQWPLNLMCGVSVTTQATTSRVADLLNVPGRRFVSAEPLWEGVDLRSWLRPERGAEATAAGRGAPPIFWPGLDLVICGGESGRDAHPFDLAWARRLRDDCRTAGTSYFLKQLGSRPVERLLDSNGFVQTFSVELKDSHGGDESEWTDDLRGCRAFPRVSLEAPA